ncbi:hypothetical protein, partial [Mesorhizobium sp. M2D.F.Ca.ET.185.01.1.1]|uniref:hypothetical protein n=1 Tax=Mesorhizobium sp. M2D.F.Ca.ET.185.01.1.1 TaxID=2563938 RepID=UPI001AEE74CE
MRLIGDVGRVNSILFAGMAFLSGSSACVFEKANNCGNYVGMGISYGDGGSDCESYLSIKYGIDLFSQS